MNSKFDRQLFCMEYFRDNLNWEDYKCAALVGCMKAESNLYCRYVNKSEKNGTDLLSPMCNKDQAYGTQNNPWSYSAGILGWKQTNRKEHAIERGLGINKDKAIVIIKSKGIESLRFEQQLHCIVAEITQGIFKDNFLIAINKCETLKDAVATIYCRYINGYSTKTNIPNNKDIRRIDKYDIEFDKRLKLAEQALYNYHHSIDI